MGVFHPLPCFTGPMASDPAVRSTRPNVRAMQRRVTGGVEGNSRLTAAAAGLLIVLLAIEGATLPFLRPLLSLHVFVGMLLLGPVRPQTPARPATGFARYHPGSREYVRQRAAPASFMRLFVAPRCSSPRR